MISAIQSDYPNHLREISGISPPVDTVGVMVPSSLIKRVEVIDPDMTSPDKPVIGNHRSGDTTEQDTVGTEVVGEGGGRCVEQPGVHADTDDGGDVTTSSNVDVSGEKSGQVTSSRDRVGRDVEEQLNVDEASADLGTSAY